MKNDYNVIVIGGGGAGLAAAVSAGEVGASVLLVEAAERLGGSTSLSHGVFYASNTSVQAKAGVSDSPDAMYTYAMALNQYRMEPSLLRRYCDEGASTLDWLISLGVEFPPNQVSCTGSYSEMSGVRRCHVPVGYGAAITSALEAALQRHSVDVALKTRIKNLHKSEGSVRGIDTDGTTVTADAVIVTTGGFGANRELLELYYPDAARNGNETWYLGSDHCQGDSLTIGAAVDVDVAGFNRGLILPTANLLRILELPPCWITLVNRDGRRFMNEAVGYGVMSGLVDSQANGECYGIFDSAAFQSPPRDPRFRDAMANGIMTTQWTHDVLQAALNEGRVVQGETLEELAIKLNIKPEPLRASVERQNADAATKTDSLFFKEGTMMRPIGLGPYYGTAFRSAILCFTSTGMRIDQNTQVMNASNRPISGLYAAGEASGGVMGEKYLGSGSSVANAIIFGRIAGHSAAKLAISHQDLCNKKFRRSPSPRFMKQFSHARRKDNILP